MRHPCAELAYNAHQLALNVPVALSEALSNAILRGNDEDPDKRVRVRADVDTLRLVVDVQDEGERFDLDGNDPRRRPTRRTSSARTAAGCSSCAR